MAQVALTIHDSQGNSICHFVSAAVDIDQRSVRGNPECHGILRGGNDGPNYSAASPECHIVRDQHIDVEADCIAVFERFGIEVAGDEPRARIVVEEVRVEIRWLPARKKWHLFARSQRLNDDLR